jgi:hypothetical protein
MTHHPDPTPRKAYHQWMAAGSAFAKAVIRDSEREEPMNQGKSKGVSNYEIIDSGICPKCRGKMRSSDHTENNGFNWYCDHCQLLYKFHDDPGPGAYSTIVLKPGPKVVEEPMKPNDEEKKNFNPREGDRILVGWEEDKISMERIHIYTDKHGMFVCADGNYEDEYRESKNYIAQAFPYAKPLPPKALLPPKERLKRIAQIIWDVDNRCMAADGPVTPALDEMTQEMMKEISEIWELSKDFR